MSRSTSLSTRHLAFLRRALEEYTKRCARTISQCLSMPRLARKLPAAQLGCYRLVHVTTVPMSLLFIRGQTGYMRSRGIDIQAISSPGEDLEAFAQAEVVRVQSVEMPRRITPLRDLVAIARLSRILRQIRPDIVHAHTPKGGLLGMIAATMTRTPVRIYHLRGLPLAGARGPLRWLLCTTEWLSCRLAHRVLCVSQSIRNIAITERLCPAWKAHVLLKGSGNGVDAQERFNPAGLGTHVRCDERSRLGIPANALVIGFVGRLACEKGIVDLARAWTTISAEYPAARLLLVGPFEPRDPVDPSVMQALQEDSRVRLIGMERSTAPLYAAMDLVVLPTYREGFPNVPLEAAAMGLPVVTTRIPGCVDAVEDDVTGTLVPPRDPDALTGAMRRYLDDPELRRRHGEAGRARVLRDFRPEAIWEALHAEYMQLLHARTPSPAQRDVFAEELR